MIDIDIDVGEAHAIALGRAGWFSRTELGRVLAAYERARGRVRRELARRRDREGEFHDLHPLVERTVAELAGREVGGRVHLGKSRNDQVAADTAIFVRRRLQAVMEEVSGIQRALIDLARREGGAVFPAMTHTRPAQATTVAAYACAYADALGRDLDRLMQARARVNRSPLGAAAVAGTSVRVDRRMTARLLGFDGVWPNPIDATSSRDHLLEVLAALAILQSTLSRLAADLILLSADAFGVFEYPDELADTSSAMPQKKNPDPLEMVRARSGTVGGALAAALTVVHGLPAGYSRDLQEIKPALWRGLDASEISAEVVRLVVERIRVRPGRAERMIERGFAVALDVAEALCAAGGLPFRTAHYAVGVLVRSLANEGRGLSGIESGEAARRLSLAARRTITISAAQWREWIDPVAAVRRRARSEGGSEPARVRAAGRRVARLGRAVRDVAAGEARAQRALRTAVKARTEP